MLKIIYLKLIKKKVFDKMANPGGLTIAWLLSEYLLTIVCLLQTDLKFNSERNFMNLQRIKIYPFSIIVSIV